MKVRSVLGTVFVAAFSMISAQAAVFNPLAPLPGGAQGLSGSYWKVNQGINYISDAETDVGSTSPTDTFTITEIFTNYPGDTGTTLEGFLNANGTFATNFVGADPNTTFDISQSYYTFIGYLVVPTSGTWNFQTTSDDGSQLLINNTLVVNNDGNHGGQPSSGLATFNSAGLYGFEVKFFENGGGTMIQVQADKSGGNNFTPLGGSDFAQTPEPGALALLGAGGLVMSAWRRRMGRRA